MPAALLTGLASRGLAAALPLARLHTHTGHAHAHAHWPGHAHAHWPGHAHAHAHPARPQLLALCSLLLAGSRPWGSGMFGDRGQGHLILLRKDEHS